MGNIKISDLCSTGSELFSDSESYMSELNDSAIDSISGGTTPICAISIASSYPCFVATSIATRLSQVNPTSPRAISDVITGRFD